MEWTKLPARPVAKRLAQLKKMEARGDGRWRQDIAGRPADGFIVRSEGWS